jgi:hypothetical protein
VRRIVAALAALGLSAGAGAHPHSIVEQQALLSLGRGKALIRHPGSSDISVLLPAAGPLRSAAIRAQDEPRQASANSRGWLAPASRGGGRCGADSRAASSCAMCCDEMRNGRAVFHQADIVDVGHLGAADPWSIQRTT